MSQCTMEPETIQEPRPGRDANGRFAKGNAGGPGNPFGRRVAAMREVLVNAITDEELHQVMRMLLRKAPEGSESAAKILIQYTVGKPRSAVEPDRVDVEEWALHRESNVGAGEISELTDGVPVKVATVMAEAMVPAKEQKMKEMWVQCEEQHAAQRAEEAAEDAAIERGMEEARRLYREDPEYRRQWDESAQRTATLDEIMAPPPLPIGANGVAGPSPNGTNGGRAGLPRGRTIV